MIKSPTNKNFSSFQKKKWGEAGAHILSKPTNPHLCPHPAAEARPLSDVFPKGRVLSHSWIQKIQLFLENPVEKFRQPHFRKVQNS